MNGEDTIAAIATGSGEAGIGIIRVSGPDAIAVGEKVFRAKQGGPLGTRHTHTLTYGWVVDGDGRPVDESLAALMRGPRSFTGEDVVEFHCHGGQVAVRRVLDATLLAGARLAEPGEFTRRAFLSGRIDLSQAESVIDIIRAKTDGAMEAAVNQLRGGLSERVRAVRDRLLEMAAHLEADIDFPELELEVQTFDQVAEGCRWALGEIRSLLAGARQGKLLRDGFRVVLAGRPNVGKSSLLNRLVRENRAIVTSVPGTTRDVIEEWINIRELPVILVDTAGIRETQDLVEQLGVERSREQVARAGLVLQVMDAAQGWTAEDEQIRVLLPDDTERIVLANKIDLVPECDLGVLSASLGGASVLGVSAQSGVGLAELEERIAAAAGLDEQEERLMANARQEEVLRRAADHLEAVLATHSAGYGSDLLSIDVRSAWITLGEITGESVGEDLLDQIFSRFCIGK